MDAKNCDVAFWVVFRYLIDNPFAYTIRFSSAPLHSYVLQEVYQAPITPGVAVVEAIIDDPKHPALQDFLLAIPAETEAR